MTEQTKLPSRMAVRPRLGTFMTSPSPVSLGVGLAEQSSIPSGLRNPSCSSTPKALSTDCNSMERRVFRRRDRILDWPQFKLRRKLTTPIRSVKTERESTSTKQAGPRHPMRAIHPALTNTREARITKVSERKQDSSPTRKSLSSITVSKLIIPDECQTAVLPHYRKGIATNPNVRRRYSADGIPLGADDDTGPTPAKRSYLGATAGELRSINDSVQSVNTSLGVGPDAPPARKRRIYGGLSSKSVVNLDTYNNGETRAGMMRRASKSVVAMTNFNAKHRRSSDILTEFRRSAKETLHTLCKALRKSTTSLVSDVESENEPPDSSPLRNPTPCSIDFANHEKVDMHRTQSGKYSSVQSSPMSFCSVQRERMVRLERKSLNEPFGLFVVKSKIGFQITRITDNCRVVGSAALRVGDEIVQVNDLLCRTLSLTDLIQLFRDQKRLMLTILSKDTSIR
ncbi:unnamed protein product [Calicophoron daubneyi]|uniref:PDZ domain-containing protein n=1 Tax=Calicophoron daubneyi TaxID=300641 RepID=A0AAV2SWV6_CALDB